MLTACGVSDIGPVRKTNEDGFAADEELQLFVVADGMGGHLAGEVASSLAVETIAGFIRRSEEDGDCSWPYGIEPDLSFCGNRLRTAIHLANRRVFRAAEKYDEYTGMGTTVVCALDLGKPPHGRPRRRQPPVPVADGTLTQLTIDDTWAATVSRGPQPRHRSAANASDAPRADQRARRARQAEVHLQEHELQRRRDAPALLGRLHNVVDDDELSRAAERRRSAGRDLARG